MIARLTLPLLLLVSACESPQGSSDTEHSSPTEHSSQEDQKSAASARAEKNSTTPEKVAAMKPASKAKAPREREAGASEVFGTLPSGIGLAKGSPIPDAKVTDLAGKSVQFSDMVNEATLLVFYRGGWCPYCNFQIRQLTKLSAELEARGVSIVAVSVDQPSEGAKTSSAYAIPFPVLSDSDLELHRAFRVLNQLDEEYVSMLKGKGMDVTAHSGKSHGTVAVPSMFLLNDGKVAFAHAEENHRVRPSVKQVVGMLDELGFAKK